MPALIGACAIIVVWALTGPLFGFSDTWQLLINTFTTLVTFVMVFVIQNTANRDMRAIHTKLDALLAGVPAAPTELQGLEDQAAHDIKATQQQVREAE